MEDHYKAWKSAFDIYGVDLIAEDYYRLEGTNVYELAKILLNKYNLNTNDYMELVKKKELFYLNNNKFRLYSGVIELLNKLCSKKIKIGIVTAGLLSRLNSSVPSNFLQLFDVIITSEDSNKGKPSPEPYLKGVKKLGIEPNNCIVIENAPLGIESAKRAGTYCIAISSTVDKMYLTKADEIVKTFQDLNNVPIIKDLVE